MSDPFVVVQEDVVSAFEQARTLLASWQALERKARSPQEENEFQYVTDELYSALKAVGGDLDDLQETIDVARAAPGDYGLTGAQVAERQAFVSAKRKGVEDMRRALERPRRKVEIHVERSGETRVERNAEFDGHQLQHQMVLEQQDQQLDSMLSTVRNLHGIAGTMNAELDTHAILLDEVDTLVDRTQSRLDSARRRVDRFLRDKSNRSIYTVLILFAVILVLLALIIFT
ncbi:Syntaxin-10 [Coemansia javaensis]|uniref:Syntaxin-10 n=1 Tax=Coemansia javaensis TaxID=2761396 RepID=A0A9W8H878_9FUNG|nr:Syntaxin-10 [Coemansia javaensis]